MYDSTKPSTSSVLDLIKSTWKTPNLKVTPDTYAVFQKKFNLKEVDHTDGIGTKAIYHWNMKTYKYAVLDALAMNLNDLLLVRAKAYKLQNHLTLPKEDNTIILEIMKKMVSECYKRKIAITGGETSIHDSTGSFDIGITISGFINKPKLNKAKTGDILIGLKSNGLHSNGFTLVRKLFKGKYRDEFTKPTRIYYDDLINLLNKIEINGMMHITGGAFSKIKGIIDDSQDVVISNPIKPQKIFKDIYDMGLPNKRMYKTFNCGTGFILTTPKSKAEKLINLIPNAHIIGEVAKGTGNIIIRSSFDNRTFSL